MPDASYLSLTGAKIEAAAAKTLLANSVLHCFKQGFNPSPTSTLADFLAHEADFDGYAPLTIATWANPVLAGVAYAIFAPTQTFRWVLDMIAVGNQIGGTFLVTSGGDLYQYTQFDPTRPIQGPDQAIITTPTDVFPAG
jgi:hypothetical protein